MATTAVINPDQYGISFSLKQCRNFGVDGHAVLSWLLEQGWRRFRLMSYWDEHEKQPGNYDFGELDWQIGQIAAAGGKITLCLGARQPRWPENHWPDWAWQTTKELRGQALLAYITQVVERYRNNPAVISWQLENEALLKSFGRRAEVDRKRLRREFAAIKQLDSSRPLIMSTSTAWGIPIRRPLPDIVGFSYYQTVYGRSGYHRTMHRPWLIRLRKLLVRITINRPVFIHEMQLEPWGPTAIWKMTVEEQDKSMSPEHIRQNLAVARKVKAPPTDLWGAEWWYWRTLQDDDTIWQAVSHAVQ
jgi:hypothetical protein